MAEEKEKPIEKDQQRRFDWYKEPRSRQPQPPPSKQHHEGLSATMYEKIGWFSHHFVEKIVSRYKS